MLSALKYLLFFNFSLGIQHFSEFESLTNAPYNALLSILLKRNWHGQQETIWSVGRSVNSHPSMNLLKTNGNIAKSFCELLTLPLSSLQIHKFKNQRFSLENRIKKNSNKSTYGSVALTWHIIHSQMKMLKSNFGSEG